MSFIPEILNVFFIAAERLGHECFLIFNFIDEHAVGFVMIACLCIIVWMGLDDLLQTKHTIKRNFPVIGFMRYALEFIGPELRQYLFHDERSDRPIPRYIRTWVYAHSKGQLGTVAFGTKKDLDKPGTILMRHSHFPVNPTSAESHYDQRVVIGARRRYPYESSIFNISAMSYGALGKNAILALSQGAQKGHFYHNTGEGGASSYHFEGGADLVMQIGTGKFGVRNADGSFSEEKFLDLARRPQIKMFEIKLSQGAKPGKGGVLPKEKITDEIATIRGVLKNQDVVSPPRHVDWNDNTGMLKWIDNLQNKGGKPIGIKFCLGRKEYVYDLIQAMKDTGMMPDFITVDGAEGATGAAPLAHTDYLGYPLKDALMFVDNALREAGLREHIRLIASGKIITGADLAIILALGADLAQSARGFMLSIGCIHALKCNTNHCPAGIATHDSWLQRGLVVTEKSPRVANYHAAVLYEFNSVLHSCGYKYPQELKRSDVMKVVDYNKIVTMDELIPQPPLKACIE